MSMFQISSSVRPLTTKPCIVLLLDNWLGRYLDPVTLTYILRSSAFYTFYVDVQYLLYYKAYNHQTLYRASPQCTGSAGSLTRWPWPIFRAPLTFTPFTSPFHMSSTIRPSATKPCVVLFSMYWLGRYLDPVTLTYILHSSAFDIF